MKAKQVLTTLNITRPTLTKYVKTGLIKVDSVVNGQYNYNEESIKSLLLNNEYNDHLIKPVRVEKTETTTEKTDKNDTINEIDNVIKVIDNLNEVLFQLELFRILLPESVSKLKENKKLLLKLKEKQTNDNN